MDKNRLIVITGGTQGIGRALVERFAGEGFPIATCARNKPRLDSLKQEWRQKFPNIECYTFQADLSQKEEVLQFAQNIEDLSVPIGVLINNAGIFLPGQVHSEEEGALENMINTNLYSAYHLTRKLIPGMIERKSGHIFNICSTASIMPYINGGSYCISKYALLGFSKVLREEMKEHQVRVTAVLPGATYTASWESTDLPPERMMKPEDVAEIIYQSYMLSDRTVIEDILMRPQLGDI